VVESEARDQANWEEEALKEVEALG